MISNFELLPAEIFFEIFDYLTVFDIFHSFINLNKRLNEIVNSYPIELDFQRISRSKFDFICRYIKPKQIISIYLSDELMPNQVELFKNNFPHFNYEFLSLKKLHLLNTSTILSNLPICLTSLSIKTYLKANNTDYVITKILQKQANYLTYLKVDGSYSLRSINQPFPLLKYLIIDFCTIGDFHQIKSYFNQSLTYLKVYFDKDDNQSRIDFEHLSKSLNHLTIMFAQDIFMTFDLIKYSIDQLINLTNLTIQATGSLDLMNGYLWEEYLNRRNIKKFNFKFTLAPNLHYYDDNNSLIEPFRSKFWLETHQWYVTCEKRYLHMSRPTLYTVPYFQSSFIFYPPNNIQSISTNENKYLIKNNNSIHLILSFHKAVSHTMIFFDNVYALTLLTSILPSIDTLKTIVNLKQIKELDASLIKTYSIEDFQNLIDLMVHLKTITMQYNPLFSPPLHIDSYIFIRNDNETSVLNSTNIEEFCYLFFHVKYLEITVQNIEIIIQLLSKLHYLERVKIFCYHDYLLNIKSRNWLEENIPRLKKLNFTYRTTSSSLFLSIGGRKMFVDEKLEKTDKHSIVKCSWYKSCTRCKLQ